MQLAGPPGQDAQEPEEKSSKGQCRYRAADVLRKEK